MNADPENFDSLKKLLAAKRHEQPPPGYFNELPKKIWHRIETEEVQISWWERVFGGIALKPAVAYAFGLVVCGTLIIGIGSSLNSDRNPVAVSTPLPQQQTLGPSGVGLAEGKALITPAKETSSTNPVTDPVQLFQPDIQVQPVLHRPD
jgi:hypothetical protein